MWGAESVRGSLFGSLLMPNSDPEGQTFLSAPNNHDRFFFLHTFWSPAFDFNGGFSINASHVYMLTSAILKIVVEYDITMTPTPNILMTELRDLLYYHCIDNTCCYSIFIYPTGQIRVCQIRFVSTGESHKHIHTCCPRDKRKWQIIYNQIPWHMKYL